MAKTFQPTSSAVRVTPHSPPANVPKDTELCFQPTSSERLVGESQIPPNLSPTYTGSSENVSGFGLAGEFRKIRTRTQTGLRLRRLLVRPPVQSGLTNTGLVAGHSRKYTDTTIPTGLSGPAIHVFDGSANSHRETSSPRTAAYETHTVAFEKQLEGTRNSGKSDSYSQVPAPPWWLKEDNILTGQPSHPIKHAL